MSYEISAVPSIDMLIQARDGLQFFESNKFMISLDKMTVYNKKFQEMSKIQNSITALLNSITKLNSEIVEEMYLNHDNGPEDE